MSKTWRGQRGSVASGEGGSAAFGGKAVLGATAAKDSGLNVYLFSPLVSTAEALAWDLLARDRDDAVAATPARKRIHTNAADSQGILVSLERAGVEGVAGNLWQFRRGNVGGAALSIVVFANARVIELQGPTSATYTTAELFALINAHADLSAVYFGGEDGSSTEAPDFDDTVQNAVVPRNFFGGVNAIPAEALGILVDEDAQTVTYRAELTDTLGDVKAAIDAIDGLVSEYFGGADAATLRRTAAGLGRGFHAGHGGCRRGRRSLERGHRRPDRPVRRIAPVGMIALAQIPDAIMRDAEFTASAVRTLLDLTADEANDLFTGATIADRVITITQNDGSTFTLTVPAGTSGGTMADGVVSAGAFSADGETLTLTVDGAADVTISVPALLRATGGGEDAVRVDLSAKDGFPFYFDIVAAAVGGGAGFRLSIDVDGELYLNGAADWTFIDGRAGGSKLQIWSGSNLLGTLTLPVNGFHNDGGERIPELAAGEARAWLNDIVPVLVVGNTYRLRFSEPQDATVIQFLAEGADFPTVADAVNGRLYVKPTGEGRIKGSATTNAVGAQGDVEEWAVAAYKGEGAGDASVAGAALAATGDYYYDTTTERLRQRIADGTVIAPVDARNEIFGDGVTLLSNGSYIAGTGRYANLQAALDYLDESFHEDARPQVTTFTSFVYFDVEEDDVRVVTNFVRSVAAGTEDALVPLDSAADRISCPRQSRRRSRTTPYGTSWVIYTGSYPPRTQGHER